MTGSQAVSGQQSALGWHAALGRADIRAIVGLHLALVIALGGASLLEVPAKGWAIFAIAVAYNVALPVIARAYGRQDWFALWAFLLPLSIFQVLPDWVVSASIGTLQFSALGGPRLDDAIPLAMAGLWVPPLFVALALAGPSAAKAAGLAVLIFLGSEILAPAVDLWKPVGGVSEIGGVALYVLPAEAALGWAASVGFTHAGTAAWPRRVGVAFAISVFYLGALVAAHFLIDLSGWGLTT